uniref:Transmembrane protein n=1 Tax=Panagrolaimus sp. JU765 TaxID=591449 RepID=A0AC34QAD0_9BILA
MAAPVAFRTKNATQQNIASFPPPVYYRDTYGLQPLYERKFTDSMTTEGSDDSDATKSTIRTNLNIFHVHNNVHNMMESQTSKNTDITPSYHVEQILTNQVLTPKARMLWILTVIAFASAVQLLLFAVICLFFDGAPYYLSLICSILFIVNATIVGYFIQKMPSTNMLILCCITTSISFILSVALFFWTVYLVYGEDKEIRTDGFDYSKANLLNSNRIVTNTRLAMYYLHMFFSPIQALCCAAILYILYESMKNLNDEQITKGYFFSHPTGHQTVLVPIELRQVRRLDRDPDMENISIGVQTSGTQKDPV